MRKYAFKWESYENGKKLYLVDVDEANLDEPNRGYLCHLFNDGVITFDAREKALEYADTNLNRLYVSPTLARLITDYKSSRTNQLKYALMRVNPVNRVAKVTLVKYHESIFSQLESEERKKYIRNYHTDAILLFNTEADALRYAIDNMRTSNMSESLLELTTEFTKSEYNKVAKRVKGELDCATCNSCSAKLINDANEVGVKALHRWLSLCDVKPICSTERIDAPRSLKDLVKLNAGGLNFLNLEELFSKNPYEKPAPISIVESHRPDEACQCACGRDVVSNEVAIHNVKFNLCSICVADLGKETINALL